MKLPIRRRGQERRRGAAVVEFAVCLPFLIFVFLMLLDYCRVFYGALTTGSCARNSSYQAADPTAAVESPYPTLQAAAYADGTNLPSSSLSFSTANGTDPSGNPTITTSVGYHFDTITNFPAFPASTNLTRSTMVRQAPPLPNFQ